MMRILNIGSVNIDYVYSVPHFVQAGETLESGGRQIFPGGKGLNQSIALARAGSDVSHAAMLGGDGGMLLEIMQESGVDISLCEKVAAPSGHAIIQVNAQGENCILLYPGANFEIDKAFIDKAVSGFGKDDILVLQNETSCVAYAMQAAKERGMKIAFNPSPFDAGIEKYPLDLVDYWLLNEVEGGALGGIDRFPNAVVVLTLGADGVQCRANGKTLSHKSYEVEVADTTAAGDTFTGYFISSVSKGESLEKALQTASRAASISVSRQGAAVSIPTYTEVLKYGSK